MIISPGLQAGLLGSYTPNIPSLPASCDIKANDISPIVGDEDIPYGIIGIRLVSCELPALLIDIDLPPSATVDIVPA
jgi:hypothetical protein